MAPNMIRPVSGFMPKVRGSSSATPMAAERPGIQPMTIPIVTPRIIMPMFIGENTCKKPAAIKPNVFASIRNSLPSYKNSPSISPLGSGTFRNQLKVKYVRTSMTSNTSAMYFLGILKYCRQNRI